MQNIIIKYHNVDTKKLDNLINVNNGVIQRIQNEILKLPALNIVNNQELLNQTIIQTNKFAKNKPEMPAPIIATFFINIYLLIKKKFSL